MIKKFDFDLLQANIKEFHNRQLTHKKILVAVSGGEDSVVLMDHLYEMKKKIPTLHIDCLYVHHGLTGNKNIDAYRDSCRDLVEKISDHYGCQFFTNTPQKVSDKQSEQSLRNMRHAIFKSYLDTYDFLATAHHQDDVVETLLIRLIRGTGAQGLATMSYLDGAMLRPLIHWTKEDVSKYAQKKKLKFLADPSNDDTRYLRNWIRQNWLKDLDAYKPGSLKSFKRSLLQLKETLAEESRKTYLDPLERAIEPDGIKKSAFLFLNKAEQRALLALYLNKMNMKNYKTTHLDEILKRLDSPRKKLTFELLKCRWTIDTEHISAVHLDL